MGRRSRGPKKIYRKLPSTSSLYNFEKVLDELINRSGLISEGGGENLNPRGLITRIKQNVSKRVAHVDRNDLKTSGGLYQGGLITGRIVCGGL